MRTTVGLPPAVHRRASELAKQRHQSLSATVTDHEHHAAASVWAATVPKVAACPMVEGALTRILVRIGEGQATAAALLDAFHRTERGEFWTRFNLLRRG